MSIIFQLISQVPWFTLIQAAAIVLVVALIKLTIQRYRRHKIFDKGNLPSLANKNPFSGNIFDIFAPEDNVKIIHNYHKWLGKSFGAFYGTDPWVLTEDLDLLQRVFIKESSSTNIALLRTPFKFEFGKSSMQMESDSWRPLRRTLNPILAHKQIKSDNVARDIEIACEKTLEYIANHPIESSSGGRIVDVLDNFKKFALNVFYKIAFGQEDVINMEPGVRDKVIENIEVAERSGVRLIFWLGVIISELRWAIAHLIPFTKFGKLINSIHSMLNRFVEERRDLLLSPEGPPTQRLLVDGLIEALDGGIIDRDNLKATLFFFLTAGFATSAHTLTILFWLLARHKDVQLKLRQAIRDEGENARYLEWCLHETLRLYPVVPITGRVLDDDITTQKGQTLFKGTTVMPNIYSIHRNKEYWGPDVDEFRPERFGAGDLHPVQFFAFGQGPRGCIGRSLAMAEMRSIVTKILIKYQIDTCESTPAAINWTSPHFIHILVDHPINLRFIEL